MFYLLRVQKNYLLFGLIRKTYDMMYSGRENTGKKIYMGNQKPLVPPRFFKLFEWYFRVNRSLRASQEFQKQRFSMNPCTQQDEAWSMELLKVSEHNQEDWHIHRQADTTFLALDTWAHTTRKSWKQKDCNLQITPRSCLFWLVSFSEEKMGLFLCQRAGMI